MAKQYHVDEYIERLAAVGIKHTKHLFGRAKLKRDRAELSRSVDVPGDVLLELVKMSDLARAGWVGPIFARLIYEAGADTLEELSKRQLDLLPENTDFKTVTDQAQFPEFVPKSGALIR